jgi:transcriptional regulator with XRE-family HTH domain
VRLRIPLKGGEKMDYVKDFGSYLKELRLEKGLTIKALSSLSEVSIAYLSQLENGKRGIPSKEILEKLSIHLEIESETLLERAGYIRFRELRNNLVHQGLNDFLEKNDITQFIENTVTYCIDVIRGQLLDERLSEEKKNELLTLINSYLNIEDINNELDLFSFKDKIMKQYNPKLQLFFVLSLINLVQNSYTKWYNANKINEQSYNQNSFFMGQAKNSKILNKSTGNIEKIQRISPGIRFRVLRRDHSTCQICGAKAPDTKIEVDYINPILKEKETFDNLQAICVNCQIGMEEEYLRVKAVSR